jgi:hypothetical protein
MAISMVRAKALCSGAELALVKASTKQEIGTHTAARLKQKQTRARALRDKWRDQTKTQKRASQAKAAARGVAGNKNSAEKAALFDEVLNRFTAQLEKAEADGKTPGPMGRRRSTRSARSRKHRASRAEVRSELAEAKRAIKSKKKATAAEPIVSEPAPATAMTKGADAPPKVKRSRVPVAAGTTAIVAGREAQGLHVTKLGQIQASANAKQNRLKASGMIRIQKNRSAANKRSQGKRDSR